MSLFSIFDFRYNYKYSSNVQMVKCSSDQVIESMTLLKFIDWTDPTGERVENLKSLNVFFFFSNQKLNESENIINTRRVCHDLL